MDGPLCSYEGPFVNGKFEGHGIAYYGSWSSTAYFCPAGFRHVRPPAHHATYMGGGRVVGGGVGSAQLGHRLLARGPRRCACVPSFAMALSQPGCVRRKRIKCVSTTESGSVVCFTAKGR